MQLSQTKRIGRAEGGGDMGHKTRMPDRTNHPTTKKNKQTMRTNLVSPLNSTSPPIALFARVCEQRCKTHRQCLVLPGGWAKYLHPSIRPSIQPTFIPRMHSFVVKFLRTYITHFSNPILLSDWLTGCLVVWQPHGSGSQPGGVAGLFRLYGVLMVLPHFVSHFLKREVLWQMRARISVDRARCVVTVGKEKVDRK